MANGCFRSIFFTSVSKLARLIYANKMKDPKPLHHRTKGGNLLSCIERSYWTGVQFRPTRMNPSRVIEDQQKRLRHLLEVARARSSYYREKFRHIDVGCSKLEDFPIMTKAEMMTHFDQVVTDPVVTRSGVEEFIEDIRNVTQPFLGKYSVSHTSGSQGQPTLIVQN
ncbi:MAG: hypothetical protein B7Z37_29075, partial [Verrucomicrobia bacterium 12-59-8]